MGNLVKKIKAFFFKIFLKNKMKKLEEVKDTKPIEETEELEVNQKEAIVKGQSEKKEFFEIYQKIKNGQYNLKDLTEEQSQKIIAILHSEIALKKDKLNHNITELNILKTDNRIDEKNRIFELYHRIKDQTIALSDIEKEDLIKIRKLLLEEAKKQDERLGDEINLLNRIAKPE